MATRERILTAARKAFATSAYGDVSLAAVATRAGVGIQTLIRHFRSKEVLFTEAQDAALAEAQAARDFSPPESVAVAVDRVLGYYRLFGPMILHFLDQTARTPELRASARRGADAHEVWIDALWQCLNTGKTTAVDRAVRAVALDIRTWEHLALRRGLEPPAIRATIMALLGEN